MADRNEHARKLARGGPDPGSTTQEDQRLRDAQADPNQLDQTDESQKASDITREGENDATAR